MLLKQLFKKALLLSAFFVFFLSVSQSYADQCDSDYLSKPETATVKWVYDGDTILLTDKRKIRIIGIDTPEVKHHKQKAQAYGAKAREALRELLKRHDYNVTLRFGKEKKDRYSRVLAHVFTPDNINISSWLLAQGFAKTMSIPPNIQLADCYKEVESEAQEQSLRIWKLKRNKLTDAATLSLRKRGFVRLRGVVTKVSEYRKTLTMELESTSKHPIIIKIRKANRRYFKKLDQNKLWGQTIRVSGVLKKRRGKRVIYLNHSSQLELSLEASIYNKQIDKNKNTKKVKPTIEWSQE